MTRCNSDPIANIIETIEYFKTQEPVLGSIAETEGNFKNKDVRYRFFWKKNEEKLVFPLDNSTETCYIYSVSQGET